MLEIQVIREPKFFKIVGQFKRPDVKLIRDEVSQTSTFEQHIIQVLLEYLKISRYFLIAI